MNIHSDIVFFPTMTPIFIFAQAKIVFWLQHITFIFHFAWPRAFLLKATIIRANQPVPIRIPATTVALFFETNGKNRNPDMRHKS